MFNYFYNSYKLEILKTSSWGSIKELKTYEKAFLVIVVLGAILSGIFSMLAIMIGLAISIALILSGFLILIIMRNRKVEQRRIVEEKIGPLANERMQNVIKLLISFEIDINDEEQLSNLIEQARKQQTKYDVWKGFRSAFNGITTYILLPIVTIFLSELLKNISPEVLLRRAVVIFFVCAGIVVAIVSFAESFNDILNHDIWKLECLISDIEEIKVFSNKAKYISDIYKGNNQ